MKIETKTLNPDLLRKIDAYWRAANYLSVGQIYLYDNPLLKRPLTLADVKHMLQGHWGPNLRLLVFQGYTDNQECPPPNISWLGWFGIPPDHRRLRLPPSPNLGCCLGCPGP